MRPKKPSPNRIKGLQILFEAWKMISKKKKKKKKDKRTKKNFRGKEKKKKKKKKKKKDLVFLSVEMSVFL